jgi:RNA polymerase sigma factor (sigma-70 family)
MSEMVSLLEPLIPALRRYARSFAKDKSGADDLVQDTLERAVSRWYQRRADGDARAWVFSILHNLAISGLRQAGRRGQHLPLDDAHESDVAVPFAQEDGLRRRDILTALSQLPEDQRGVLLLVSVEDMSYAQVARILDLPIGTVMSRLARARSHLRKLMEDDSTVASGRPQLRRNK